MGDGLQPGDLVGLDAAGGMPQQRRAGLPFLCVGVRLDQQQRAAGTEVAVELLRLPAQRPVMQAQQGMRILLCCLIPILAIRAERPGHGPLGGPANNPRGETSGVSLSRPVGESAVQGFGLRNHPDLGWRQAPSPEIGERERQLFGAAEESYYEANLVRACYGHCAHWPDCDLVTGWSL
jgi:hypothetical protein